MKWYREDADALDTASRILRERPFTDDPVVLVRLFQGEFQVQVREIDLGLHGGYPLVMHWYHLRYCGSSGCGAHLNYTPCPVKTIARWEYRERPDGEPAYVFAGWGAP